MTFQSKTTDITERSKTIAPANKACRCCGNCVCKNAMKPADMADLSTYRKDLVLISVQSEEAALRVIWSDGASSRFHYAWLRENDPAPCSRHQHSRERIVSPLSINAAIRPASVSIDKAGALNLKWLGSDGGHRSRYDAGWLRSHAYALPASMAEVAATPPTNDRPDAARADWTQVMQSEDAFYDWLENYAVAGWSVISGVPDMEGCAIKLGEKIGVVRSSNFGFSFDVKSKAQPISNAFTAGYLPLHTDMPHYELPPGLQILHALRNEAVGGESLLSDGIAVAKYMQKMAPNAYKLLIENSIPFRFQDDVSDYRTRHPLFETDKSGKLAYVNWSNSTSAPLDCSFKTMKPLRAAIRLFVELTESKQFLIEYKLKAGEMLVFDNRRFLHGRNAFDPETGRRHLQGCYLDTSEVESRRLVGKRRTSSPITIAA